MNFLKCKTQNFCFIKKFSTIRTKQKLTEVCLKHIKKFYLIVSLELNLEIVEFKRIKRRCVLVELDNEAVISPCVNLEQSD